jgi:3-methyladenine DNA glycosylase AlkD
MAAATFEELMAALQARANPDNVAGMARFGMNTGQALGISVYTLRGMVKGVRDHALAQQLWQTGIHEARLLAVFCADPAAVTPEQMDAWAADFDSWDICDQACTSLFDQSPHAWAKALEWPAREEEFVRRAAFALMAGLAWHDKKSPNEAFTQFFPVIQQYSNDERNFVKKAVNWALRNIGKRNPALMQAAWVCAEQIHTTGNPTARWIASDALREFKKKMEKHTHDERAISHPGI